MNAKGQTYLAAANLLGSRLCRDAVWSESRCNWLGASMEAVNGNWTVVERACGPELYGGTSGIALFLARLHTATGEKLHRTAALGALNQAWSKRDDIAPAARIGFYSGWVGLAYARVALSEAFGLPNGPGEALKLVQSLTGQGDDAFGLDVVSGSAGAIPALLELHRRHHEEWLLEFAIRQGERLLNTARRRDEGWSWRTLEISARDDLTGFSHGAAGIGWALLELYAVTGDARWRSAALEAFRYERRWFNAQEGNWADLRTFDQAPASQLPSPACSMAWCHGAPGIALARLRAAELLDDPVVRKEAEAALASTAKSLDTPGHPGSTNFSLCHGQAGNAEALLHATLVLDPGYGRTVEAVADRGIESCHVPRAPWPCGVPGGGENPSLMLGLAGIGHFYLRLADPRATPSILMVPLPTPQPHRVGLPAETRPNKLARKRNAGPVTT